MSCEHEELLTETQIEATIGYNGEPVPTQVEVVVGFYCHYKQEYNADCNNCTRAKGE